MSRIRANTITNKAATGAPTFSNGAVVTGVCTATSFVGSGANLTGVSAGKVLQVVSQTKTDAASNNTASQNWWSYTDSSLIATITPTSASSKIMIWGAMNMGIDSQQWMFLRLEKNGVRINAVNGDQDGNKSRCFTAQNYPPETNVYMPYTNMMVQALVDAENTSSRYYNFGLAHTSGQARTICINRGTRTNNDFYTPMVASTITVMEIEV